MSCQQTENITQFKLVELSFGMDDDNELDNDVVAVDMANTRV